MIRRVRSTRSHHSLPFPHCVSAIPIRTEIGVGWGEFVFWGWFASFEVVEFGWFFLGGWAYLMIWDLLSLGGILSLEGHL